MLILGIESSCDDTSVALVNCSDEGHVIISEVTASQIEIHKKYGGVVPEIAGRMHAEKIVPLIEGSLKKHPRPDAIAVTSGPGLVTALMVGVEAARTLSYAWDIPLVGVNHIEGHIHSVEISNFQFPISNKISNSKSSNNLTIEQLNNGTIQQFPALCLIVSGGHTELVLMKDHGDYQILGATKDDAAGECFDKVAKLLGLPYPGGPEISKLAEAGRTNAIDFPRPMLKEKNYDFSFAGLKTSALYWLRDHSLAALNPSPINLPAGIFGQQSSEPTINDFCASIEQAIVDVLVAKTLRAAKEFKPKTIILCGGVSANRKLRETLRTEIARNFPNSELRTPNSAYCMDNGAMIAVAGYYHANQGQFTPWSDITVNPNWKIA